MSDDKGGFDEIQWSGEFKPTNTFIRGEARPYYWLWSLAERADWNGWRPRWFWRWLLKRQDRKHGYNLEYEP
jgi:hypothetical protein